MPVPPSHLVTIAFGVDGNYASHTAAVISSILRHSIETRFHFLILFEDFPDRMKRELEAVAPDSVFTWVELETSRFEAFEAHEHFSRAILFRLGLAELAPAECTRMIYLDADLIVTGDICDLWRTELDGKALGAVEDCFVNGADFAHTWSLPVDEAAYFNSGVLLIDLAKARQEQLFERAIDFVAEHGNTLRFTDQDALNWAFSGNWMPLDNRWNVQRHMALPSLSETMPEHLRLGDKVPGIVHFTGPEKPWLPDVYHPWAWIYWQALSGTGFEREVSRKYHMGLKDKFRTWLRWFRHRWHGDETPGGGVAA